MKLLLCALFLNLASTMCPLGVPVINSSGEVQELMVNVETEDDLMPLRNLDEVLPKNTGLVMLNRNFAGIREYVLLDSGRALCEAIQTQRKAYENQGNIFYIIENLDRYQKAKLAFKDSQLKLEKDHITIQYPGDPKIFTVPLGDLRVPNYDHNSFLEFWLTRAIADGDKIASIPGLVEF